MLSTVDQNYNVGRRVVSGSKGMSYCCFRYVLQCDLGSDVRFFCPILSEWKANSYHFHFMATRLAAHAADIVKKIPGAAERDFAISKARKELDWEKQYELAIDPGLARKRRSSTKKSVEKHGACTMCGELCAYKVMNGRQSKKNMQ